MERAVGGLLSIGAFARLARLTVKAVRHYDAEGLLPPAEVDPNTAYRYYRADPVRTAATIAVLRGLDVPLPVVREVLAAEDPDAVAAVLAGERDRQRADLARREQVLRSIDVLLTSPDRVRYDVVLTEREPVTLHGLTDRVRAEELEAGVGALCGELARTVTARVPFVAVYPLDITEEMDVMVGVPGSGSGSGSGSAEANERHFRPEGVGESAVRREAVTLPGGLWASTLHVGAYTGLPLAYAAVQEHVRALGHTPLGPFTETYLADPQTSSPDELVTRLALALEP